MEFKPTILIIFGVTGDLARKKLLPAIEELKNAGKLPDEFEVVGVSRSGVANAFQMNLSDPSEYERLAKHLESIEGKMGITQRLYYLAVPPQSSAEIIQLIGLSTLSKHSDTKLLMEKPFGIDLPSAERLIGHINTYFTLEQIYRVDHYLGKSMVQDILNSRKDSPIERVGIIASETVGVEGRANFYEQAGALRDFVQSHLLILTAITLMDTGQDMPKERLRVLENLHVVGTPKRAQYKGYREEVSNPESMVETFASIELESSQGIKVKLTTGKKLSEKRSEVRIFYKNDPNPTIFYDQDERSYQAYEETLLRAITGSKKWFITNEEVLASWRILAPIQTAWETSSDLVCYEPGSNIATVLGNN